MSDDPKRRRFADWLDDDVTPLPDRDRETPAPPTPAPRPTPRHRADEGPEEGASASFVHPLPDERLLGFAPGLDRQAFRRLRTGRWRPERRVDLHGEDRTGARARLHDALALARAAGERCVLVIHGRGHGSPQGPVLRDALPGWLAEPPLGPQVLAFAPAAPRDGGAGATYVLLRRSQAPDPD